MKVDTASGVYWSIMDLVLQLEPCLFPLNVQQMVLSYAFQLLCIRGFFLLSPSNLCILPFS